MKYNFFEENVFNSLNIFFRFVVNLSYNFEKFSFAKICSDPKDFCSSLAICSTSVSSY